MAGGGDATPGLCACGKPLIEGAAFCPFCGARVDAAAPAEVRKTVTLLFCDVTGSTALGERLDPEALRALMGRYFAVAKDAVERHGGTLEKFVGDAVLAVFGIPEIREDDALRAVRAAADLAAGLAVLGAEEQARSGVRFTVRTGVNTGSVIAGADRAGGAFATGDAVNVAARLEQAAAPGEVLLGADTWLLVRDAVQVEAVPPLSVKGKSEPLVAYRLLGVRDVDRGRARGGGRVLVGRERELEAMRDALARAVDGERTQLITVLGIAGAGKSALLERFLDGVGPQARVLSARCVSYGHGITFWPVVQLIRQAASIDADADEASARAALVAALDGAGEAAAVVDRLLPLLGLGGEPGGSAETFWAVRMLLEHLASREPLIVTVDDLHWAEPMLLDLLDEVRAELRDLPLLLLVQARPELMDARPTWGGGSANARTFELEPLRRDQTDAVLAGVLGGGIPAAVGALIERWAEGNPLYVEELADHLVERGVLVRDGDGWTVEGDLAGIDVPPGVSALIAARLDRLPAEERQLLARLSVVGLEFADADVAALAEPGSGAEELLATLHRRDVVRRRRGPDGVVWSFRHVLVREAAYDGMAKAQRAQMHERMAEHLAGNASEIGADAGAFVAHHLEQAAVLRREAGGDAAVVADLAERAVAALSTAALTARDADNMAAADDLTLRALRLATAGSPTWRRLMLRSARIAIDLSAIDRAGATIEQLAAALDAGADASGDRPGDRPGEVERAVVRVLDLVVRAEASEDVDPQSLLELASAAIDLATGAGEGEWRGYALFGAMLANMIAARWDDAGEGVAELGRVGDAHERRVALTWLPSVLVWGSAPVAEGLRYLAERPAEAGQAQRATALNDATWAVLLGYDGQVEKSRAACERVEAQLPDLDPFIAGACVFFLAAARVATDDVAQALDELAGAVDRFEANGALSYASTLLGWQALLLLEQGHTDRARPLFERAETVTSPFDIVSVVYNATCRAVVHARDGAFEQAVPEARHALAAVDRGQMLAEQAHCRRWLAEVFDRAGDRDSARRLLTEAAQRYAAKGHRPLLARTRQLLAGR